MEAGASCAKNEQAKKDAEWRATRQEEERSEGRGEDRGVEDSNEENGENSARVQ